MPWPLIKLLPKNTKIGFVRFATIAAFASLAAVIGTLASTASGGFRQNPAMVWSTTEGGPLEKANAVFSRAFALGIDFKGGTLLTVQAPAPIEADVVRHALDRLNLGDVQVQESTCSSGPAPPYCALVSFQRADATDEVTARLRTVAPNAEFPSVGALSGKVSKELFTAGLMALGLAIVLMLIYIWFRFEWQFGLGAVVALFHDVILTLGVFSLFRIEFDLTIVAALLTIIGYSMNDTVVVFDRLRENYRKYKRMPRPQVIDLSTNETLSRTMMTSLTALLAALSLWIWGGETLRGFAIAMTFGIVIGTYSSVYVAAPVTLLWTGKSAEGAPRGVAPKTTG
jgi:preprotein translocase SecF subunit